MTAIELIDLLSKFPASTPVYIGKGMGPLEGIDVANSTADLIILRPERLAS